MSVLAHARSGSGEPLVLLHGIAHRRQGWDPVLGFLTPERDVVTVDLPGHGESGDLPADFDGTTPALVETVEALCAELGLDRPHVAGNSLGGLLALEMAARGTARSATALSPAGFWSPTGRRWARGVLTGASAALRRMGPERTARVLASPAGRVALAGLVVAHPARQDPAVLAADLQGLAAPRRGFATMLGALRGWPVPARPSVPVTVGWGSRDMLLPRRQVAALRRALPDAHVVLLPGCGHVPMADDPALVAEILLAGSRRRAPRERG